MSKLFISGCSHSANNFQSGWKDENIHKHYSSIIKKELDCEMHNIAIGGCSNREIFTRTIEANTDVKYNLCIVQWTELHRLWVYEDPDNIDSQTIILPALGGRITNEPAANSLHKTLTSYYMNDYMAVKQWLCEQIALQSFFKNKKQPYIFLQASTKITSRLHQMMEENFESVKKNDVPDQIKKLLPWNSTQDDVLDTKLHSILNLYKNIDKNNCLGYNTNYTRYGLYKHFYDDKADDGMHAGEITNKLLAEKILDHIQQKGITI